ncbi:conserved Plasmodium protein, unknown function [Plasmodium knowlesi strain H]|uniref:Fam-b protein n=3 Tax=Plasmodium knowlesi TaxID=5850 RepID=A0A5K1VBZ9_PLAKH|nr:conserved Plasmodium protein, unknown function [Plasmodium knowlesi strain H]OTN63984.1 Uncharacterized protein PKNOH_S140257900 [Plasmodium knowlesi]CAA9990994.1 conserved Plasmodium protein, unknown function [Plasmodium knowlesi strain H]SBO20745.1 conserved Plasmodium protein, unknown function [Plasmodium knowlesi strain H]SBO21194.1 conserved Plasmodium protein, unknown function [Plasmodium knowlesi strain H]VVS80468.1 conserved Plasmodium protein, unknown function [Plasmodium knowlesi |eukprot:XP_002262276.1 hypothetical protein, conserved in Plasmodium species [Plasmodium knowlesi strain H]
MIAKFLLFVILTIKTYSCFHVNYKILSSPNDKQNYVRTISSVNYLYSKCPLNERFPYKCLQNSQPKKYKNKLLSFFSNYFTNEQDRYTLNKEEKEYLRKLGKTERDNYNDLVKAHDEFIKTCSDIKSKLKYKDTFFFITQKIIQRNLYDFKRKQKFHLFGNDEYTSELSVDYIKSANIEERVKEQVLKNLGEELGSSGYFLFRVFKWKSFLEIVNISTLMLPITALGLFLSKMGFFSVAVNMLLTAHFLTFSKEEKRKMKIRTLLLTLLPILVHSSLGVLCSNIFLKHYMAQMPSFIKSENVLSFFINVQLYLASLLYFVNTEKEDDLEEGDIKNDYPDFNYDEPMEKNT